MHFVANKDSIGESQLDVGSGSKIRYLRIPVRDSVDQDLLPYLQAAIDFIEEGKTQRQCATLIHCHAGISRSASVAIAYLMKVEGMSFEEAHGFTKSCRRNIYPNSGFVKQLQEYQQQLELAL
jgi:protein-tyrosine phosphatase